MKNKILKRFFHFTIITLLFTEISFSQSPGIRFPSNDNSSSLDFNNSFSISLMRFFGDGGFYLNAMIDAGSVPVTGNGSRFVWHPGKAALRAGELSGAGSSYWDDSFIGYNSAAFGNNPRAGGNNSFSAGLSVNASGSNSIALSNNSLASGTNSFAVNGMATGTGSIALGTNSFALNEGSVAIGYSSASVGVNSISIGSSVARGQNSIALGWQNEASGDYSTVIGKNAGTNGMTGSFVVGDGSAASDADSVYSTLADQMVMRFSGGYRFYTAQMLTSGVYLNSGDNSWSSISDSSKKEKFIFYDKDEKEYLLNSLSKLHLGSWNYKLQDNSVRHYGPMAQEIFKYFGKDEYGTIGNDTTLASADIDGLIMICLQALEERTSQLRKKESDLGELLEKISILEAEYSSLETEITTHQNIIDTYKTKLPGLRKQAEELNGDSVPVSVTNK